MRQHGGLHAGTADFVDGGRTGRVRQPGAARSLPRRGLSLSGRQHVAHEHFVDPLGDNLARSTAAPITWEPSLCALNEERSPMNLPNGVRAAETMTTGSEAVAMMGFLFS